MSRIKKFQFVLTGSEGPFMLCVSRHGCAPARVGIVKQAVFVVRGGKTFQRRLQVTQKKVVLAGLQEACQKNAGKLIHIIIWKHEFILFVAFEKQEKLMFKNWCDL